MVNSISSIPASPLNILENSAAENAALEKTASPSENKAVSGHSNPFGMIDDEATISPAALERLRQSNAIRPFVQKAMSQPASDDYDHEKVSALRGLVQSGRIQEYLSTVDSHKLVTSLMSQPAGRFLKLARG